MKKTKLITAFAAATAAFALSANAASIGVNTGPDTVGDGSSGNHAQNNVLLSTYTAGAEVVQDNWNNLMQTSGWNTQAVTDDSGTLLATNVAVNTNWANSAGVLTGGDLTDGDRLLMNGSMDNGGGAQGWTITDIPYAEYDVYIYHRHSGGRGGSIQVWDTDDSNNVIASQSAYGQSGFSGTYIQATGDGTDGNGTGLESHYVKLTGLTASNVKIRSIADTLGGGGNVKRAPLAGFQIVEASAIPEPSSAILALLGLIGFVSRRKR